MGDRTAARTAYPTLIPRTPSRGPRTTPPTTARVPRPPPLQVGQRRRGGAGHPSLHRRHRPPPPPAPHQVQRAHLAEPRAHPHPERKPRRAQRRQALPPYRRHLPLRQVDHLRPPRRRLLRADRRRRGRRRARRRALVPRRGIEDPRQGGPRAAAQDLPRPAPRGFRRRRRMGPQVPPRRRLQRLLRKYQSCMFENSYGVAATDEGRAKVFGKEFAAWARPEEGDESIWEDATDGFFPGPKGSPMTPRTPVLKSVLEDVQEFEEPVEEGSDIKSRALGALENSFLVVRNFEHGIHGKGVSVKFSGSSSNFSTPKKTLLMRAETNMLLMSTSTDGKPHAKGVNQFDIETGKVVSEWKFEKDGTDINMRDITNDSKGARLDPSEPTFFGLDDNRLCLWDMRDRRGLVQNLASATQSSVLQWTQGHQFSRGTNFLCFASTGDGSIVVGSLDGKISLYSTSSMRMAKTAFPGLDSPITHVDVTYDGKWILGTTDTYLILQDGKEKTGFSGRVGNRIAAPRLLKLNPLDSHLAGADNRFREGRFSWVTENGKQERHLVATVGKYSVVWNFLQVKNSHHECYQFQEGLKSC